MENGSVHPRIGAMIFINRVLIFTVSWKIRNFPTDFAIVLLLSTQSLMEVRLLLRITTSPASCATAYETKTFKPREFKVTKAAALDYEVGDTVRHIKFGVGIVKDIVDGGRDYEVTVDFDKVGIKKMFAGFAKLKKI